MLDQIIRYLAEQRLVMPPAKGWMYSNQGYSLVGQIIAQVSGQPYEVYMQEHLLNPLGMVYSTFIPSEIEESMQAKPHINGENGVVVGGVPYDPRMVSARHLNSNCTDMTRWAEAMLNGGELEGVRILQSASIETMWEGIGSTLLPNPALVQYGLGWFLGERNGHRIAGHTGGGDGYSSQLALVPDSGLAVITLSNWLEDREAGAHPAANVAFAVVDMLLGSVPE